MLRRTSTRLPGLRASSAGASAYGAHRRTVPYLCRWSPPKHDLSPDRQHDPSGSHDCWHDRWQVAWLNAQLHDDDVAELNGLGSPAARAHQVRLLVDGYGLASAARSELVDHMIEFAIRTVREVAMAYEVGPGTTSPAADGFPVLWALAWRARSAAWMLDHRATLEAALGS